jgi:hypothetical protein
MAEYGIRPVEAVWHTALVIPLVLMAARNERHGGSGGPSYAARASTAARNKARQFLEAHFTIVPKPVHETGWKLGTEPLKL